MLQGRLVIGDAHVFFQSSFNKNNIFFGKTNLVIPKTDIL
jgi:hypothetical protein